MNNDLFFPPEATMHPLLNCLKLWLLFRSAACIALLIYRGARPSPLPPPYEDSSPLWSPGPRPRAGDPPGPTPLLWGIPWRSCRRARSWRKSSSSAEGRRMNPGLENSWVGCSTGFECLLITWGTSEMHWNELFVFLFLSLIARVFSRSWAWQQFYVLTYCSGAIALFWSPTCHLCRPYIYSIAFIIQLPL